MRNIFIYISNKHEAILKAIVVLLTIVGFLWLLPHKPRYKFDFQQGKVWNNNDLIAPFDFTILKNPDSLRNERTEIKNTVPLYYDRDTGVASEVMQGLIDRFINAGDTIGEKTFAAAQQVVNEIYRRGVLSREGADIDKNQRLVVMTGNKGKTYFADELVAFDEVDGLCVRFLQQHKIERPEPVCEIISDLVKPDVFYDKVLTETMRDEEAEKVLSTKGVVSKGDLIVSRGQIVDEQIYQILWSLKTISENSVAEGEPLKGIVLGQLALITVAITMLLFFLALLRKDIFADNRKLALMFVVMLLFSSAYTFALQNPNLSTLLVPLCILPIIMRVFFDTRLALFTHVITVLILGSVAPNGYEFVFMQIIAGMVTIFSVTNMRRRSQLFISAGMIFVAYMVCHLVITITHEGGVEGIDTMNFVWIAGNVLLTLFAYPLIYVFERIFNLISDVSLMELADTNTRLMRDLSVKAPGTFQHSMQVANLAEEAVFRIGGNALLVRVGALYHDIGKMENPLYFIENQVTGVNPHDEISFDESASIIIGHVIRGIEIAKKNKLPDLVIDFIRTHHGTTMVQYFYQSFLKNYPEEIVDEEDFRYPGPLPFSKETAVLMMADSVEASSRSMPKHDAESINNLVEDIIDRQIEQQQYINSDITFRDISIIKRIFKKMLMSIYHVRVEYPRAN